MLAGNLAFEEEEVSHANPNALRMQIDRSVKRAVTAAFIGLGLAAETDIPEQQASKERTSGPQKAHKKAPAGEQKPSNHSLESAQEANSTSPIELNLIKFNSNSISSLEENSNSIELNSIAEAPEPPQDQKAGIRTSLRAIGLDNAEIDRAFLKKNLEEIAEGIECLQLGIWKDASKKDYSDLTTMRNFLTGRLGLHSKFKAILLDRTTGSLALLFPVNGGRAKEPDPPPKPVRSAEEKTADAEEERVKFAAMVAHTKTLTHKALSAAG